MFKLETIFRTDKSRPADMGRTASTLGLLSGESAPDGMPLVKADKYAPLFAEETTDERIARHEALRAASNEAGVVDQTTLTMQRVGADGLPVEKQDN